jgi:hypothetical protein
MLLVVKFASNEPHTLSPAGLLVTTGPYARDPKAVLYRNTPHCEEPCRMKLLLEATAGAAVPTVVMSVPINVMLPAASSAAVTISSI